jgi:transcriptional regulator with XRE-family HTH domain
MRHVIDAGRTSPACTATWHGTMAAYRAGCRCPHAREDDRIYNKRRREGRHVAPFVDRTGTTRRLRGLRVQGWRMEDLAARLGVSRQFVDELCRDTGSPVHRVTSEKVAVLAHRLAGIPGPSKLTATRALRQGWVSVAAWDNIEDPDEMPVSDATPDPDYVDVVKVEQVKAGTAKLSSLTDAERVAVVAELSVRFTPAQIALRVSTSTTVVRGLLARLTADAEVAA